MKFDMVCEGGGVKIPGLAGAYDKICEKGYELSHACGTSAGAIVSAVAAAGYTPTEIRKLLMETDFDKFRDGGKVITSKVWNLIFNNGIYKGDEFYQYIKHLLAEKNIHTFKDLRYEDRNDKFAYRLKVMASDITSGSLLTLPDDIKWYGMEPDELEVALAIRMSMSIPFYFRPIIIDPKSGDNGTTLTNPMNIGSLNQKHAIVDGGLLSNFPIWQWDSSDEPEWPTFGLLLYGTGDDKPYKTNNPINLAAALFGTMMKAHDKHFIRPDDFINRTISIPTGNVSSIDFEISQQRKGMLYKAGQDAAEEFLKDWSWARYKKWATNSRNRNI